MASTTQQHRIEPAHVIDAARAVEHLRLAEASLSRRRQNDCGPSETDRLAMRYILEQNDAGRAVTPTDLARYLSVTTASITALLNRLGRGQMITLRPHPDDRRKRLVIPVDRSDDPDLIDPLTATVREAAADLSPQEAELIARFLDQITDAVGKECQH